MENQEQLIMLIKLVQKTGVDVEGIIDKWNNEVENENNNSDNISQEKEISTISDKQDYKDNKFDPSLPLTLLLSNISKGLFTPKACSQDKKGKEKSKNKIIFQI